MSEFRLAYIVLDISHSKPLNRSATETNIMCPYRMKPSAPAFLRLKASCTTTALFCLPAVFLIAMASLTSAQDRTIDGTMNNVAHAQWGAASDPGVGRFVQLRRVATAQYEDGISSPAGVSSRPGAREISNAVAAQTTSILNDRFLSDFVWQWGQFVDHDIDLTGAATPAESFDIAVPTGDALFDPLSTGTQTMPLSRSVYDPGTGSGIGNPRQQINQVTSYIDASNVYGSDAVRAAALRTNGGSGAKLRTSGGGQLLPQNSGLLPNANAGPTPDNQLFLAGDVRANEQVGLTAMHTLFVREHNRLVDELTVQHAGWSDQQLYQRARKIVGAEIQAITYEEFLPAFLGPHAPSSTGVYNPLIDATVMNEFSTSIYRLGHSMLSPEFLRIQNDGSPAPGGALALRDAFFNPALLQNATDVDVILKGLATQQQQALDLQLVDDVRNFLFGPPGSGGFDLAALNIQRGRDHGLPDYNTMREAYGLPAVADFAGITSDSGLQFTLQTLYGDVDRLDAWVGALAEDHLAGASAGALITRVMQEQFDRLRDGDRFWFENDPSFTAEEIALLRATRLSDIIRRNTSITNLPSNVFFVPEPSSLLLLGIGVGLLLATKIRRQPRRCL